MFYAEEQGSLRRLGQGEGFAPEACTWNPFGEHQVFEAG